MTENPKRFRVALSFPGERREFVERIATELSDRIGRDRVLYDRYFEAEFARPDLDAYLQRLYHDESELVVVFLCSEYERKEWCGLEWRAVRDLIKQRHPESVMPCRFDTTEIAGLFSIDGYVWIGDRNPADIAELIVARLSLIEPGANSTPSSTARGTSTTAVASELSPSTPKGDREQRIATSRLPHMADKLVGRDEELAMLDAAWGDPHVHVASLVAEGGVGKTALAVEWMTRLAARDWPGVERYFDWSFYSQGVREQGGASADAFVDAALRHFEDPQPRSTSPYERGERLARLVAERPTLLILDGVEPLQHGPGAARGRVKDPALEMLLKGLAQRPFRGVCVVTTREPIADLASYHGKTVREWKLDRLSDEAGAEVLHNAGARRAGAKPIAVSDAELRVASREVKGHALTLRLLGRYLAKAHGGDIRRRDRVELGKADDKQGGHASQVMRAYEHWLSDEGGEDGKRQLAILRLLGLFDRPASDRCIAALRSEPVIEGLTEPLVGIDEEDWNAALTELAECRLVSREGAALDAHPLIREHFARRLREEGDRAWKSAHGRLFEHLRDSTEPRPDTFAGLQPLYQAVVHGCHAGRDEETRAAVYRDRILRGAEFFSINKLGTLGADLGAVACFFAKPWSVVSPLLNEADQSRVLGVAAYCLCALGRLAEAAEVMREALQRNIKQEDWVNAAISACNLSQYELTLGDLDAAMRDAERAVELADRSGDEVQRMGKRTWLASASHQAGRRDVSLLRFREAEAMQASSRPKYPLLYSVQGFWYCDLLLADAERAAAGGEEGASKLIAGCRDVNERATQTLGWNASQQWLLDIALDHLTLGRVRLYRALLERTAPEDARAEIEQAVDGLRRAGQQDDLPRGLLTRAWLRSAMGDDAGARSDLDEAQEIAERGPMPLHLADIHLHRGRLFRDRSALAEARRLIDKHCYERRRGELEDAEAMAKSW